MKSVVGVTGFEPATPTSRTLMASERGERDPMVSYEEFYAHARLAYDIQGAGHNAHVEDPRAVLGLIQVLLGAD